MNKLNIWTDKREAALLKKKKKIARSLGLMITF